MAVRSVRLVALAVAAWAVLFAPGALGAPAGAGEAQPTSQEVAAAVVAPTFGADGLAAARACRVPRADESAACGAPVHRPDGVHVDQPAPPTVTLQRDGDRPPEALGLADTVSRRGPPTRS